MINYNPGAVYASLAGPSNHVAGFFGAPNAAIITTVTSSFGSAMDVLSEVLETLQLRCTKVESLVVEDRCRAGPPPQQALAHVVLSGDCVLRIHGEQDATALSPLDCFLLLGGQQYEIEVTPGATRTRVLRCAYSFERSLPHPFTQHFPALLCLRSHYLTDDSELGRAVSLLDGELINARLAIDFVAVRLAEIILVELLRRCQLEGAQPAFLAALSDPAVHRALQHIHAEPEHHWQVPELASRVGLSRAVFAERFHRQVGEPPLRYVRLWRLLKARRELQTTTMPIKELARKSGYGSSTGFSRAFRRVFGYPPSYLRQPPTESRTRTATSG